MPLHSFTRWSAVLSLSFWGAAACAAPPPPESQQSLLLGERIPPFQTHTMSGKPVISAAYSGQTVVLAFVTVDCKTCERTLLAAEAAFDEYREIVVVSLFQSEDETAARSIAARLKLSYPVAIDADGVITRLFRVQEVPRTFVIDADGLIRWIGGPDMLESDLRAAVEAFPRR